MRVMVIELKGSWEVSWIDGYIRDGWTPQFPASTIVHAMNGKVSHYLTLTKADE